tara:strand:- start:194 stop:502 length:309 start_codon:yes stop_codon:yes gene_type:complete
MKHEAIYNTHPSVVTIRGDNCFDADENPVTLDQAKVDAEVARLQAEYDSQAYARNRQAEYPEIGDQLDMLWHAIDTGDWTAAKVKTTEFYTALKAVKDANPK